MKTIKTFTTKYIGAIMLFLIAFAFSATVASAQTQTDPPNPPKEGYHWVWTCGDPKEPTSCGWMEHPNFTDDLGGIIMTGDFAAPSNYTFSLFGYQFNL
jgi:hypothetical protein